MKRKKKRTKNYGYLYTPNWFIALGLVLAIAIVSFGIYLKINNIILLIPASRYRSIWDHRVANLSGSEVILIGIILSVLPVITIIRKFIIKR